MRSTEGTPDLGTCDVEGGLQTVPIATVELQSEIRSTNCTYMKGLSNKLSWEYTHEYTIKLITAHQCGSWAWAIPLIFFLIQY